MKNSSIKRTIVLCGVSLIAILATAQSNMSAPMDFRIEKEVIPPYLSIIPGSVVFKDANGNNVINANEVCSVSFKIKNSGRGDGFGCVAKIDATGTTNGLTYKSQSLPTIKVGETREISFPITASQYTSTGAVKFMLSVDEPNGFGTDPVELSVETKKFESPFVEIVSYKIASDGDAQLRKKKPFKLQVLVQNTDQGVARNVSVGFTLPENMFLLDGEKFQHIAKLEPNEKKILEYELQSNANISDEIGLAFNLSESYGKYAKNSTIPLKFGQAISSGMTAVNIESQDKGQTQITRGSLLSDVDENIPTTKVRNEKTFAVIIANENYQQVASVPFALNDGSIFRKYCMNTLGIPEKNIHYVPNATGNRLKSEVNWLEGVIKAYNGEAKIIFYYAGHGVPDEGNQTAYLLPIDGSGMDITTGYKLDDLYKKLGAMGSEHVTVLLDACFSGSKREGDMIVAARGVALDVKKGEPVGNMVVFSAAQGKETAHQYSEQQHGLFTYFLLKKLQSSKGDVNLEDLGNYIIMNVRQQSIVQNSKSQTPCVTPSSTVGTSWKSWTLK